MNRRYERSRRRLRVVGQSNAIGTGDPSNAPTLPSGVAYEYHERTDRTVGIVSKPVSGAALHPDADLGAGHWNRGGTLRRRAIDSLIACLDLVEARGIEHTLRGILWHLGESDALAIDENKHTVETTNQRFTIS